MYVIITRDVVLQDVYNMRPLPYIIGTAAFIESRDAGLGDFLDEVDEEEPEVALEHGSDSDVSDTEEYSPAPAVRTAAAARNTSTASSHYDYDDGDDEEEEEAREGRRIESVSDVASEDYAAPAPKPKPDNIRNSIAAQLAARRTQISETDSDEGSHRVSDAKPPVTRAAQPPPAAAADDSDEEEESDMFGGEPEDPYSLFGAPKRKSVGVRRSSFFVPLLCV